MTIALMIEPDDQTVDPGREAVFTVHVVNQSGVVDRVALDILGSAGGWSRTDPQAVALMPGTDATATVTITPPLGTPLGSVPLGIRATAETSGFVEVGEANLNVGASRTVEAELRPRTATGKRRATSVVFLHNLGNAPTKVQVVATDPDDAIVFDSPGAVQIGPGQEAEVPLRMRLPSREKQGATLPYQVLVEGGDTGQALDGQVRQPPKKRWPVMAAMMVLGLLALAFVMLRPEDSVAIKDGAADEPVTTTVAGATTTVPGATTVAGATPENPAATPAPDGGATPGPGNPGPGGPGPSPPGGGATTAATVAANPGTVGNIPRPTQGSVAPRPPLNCPARGTPEATAQRVVCAWEAGRLGEVGDSTTPEVLKKLGPLAPIGGQPVKAGASKTDGSGATTVFFDKCVPGKGVASALIPSTGFAAGKVLDVTPCPSGTAAAPSAATP